MGFLRKHKKMLLLHALAAGVGMGVVLLAYFFQQAKVETVHQDLRNLNKKKVSYQTEYNAIRKLKFAINRLEAKTDLIDFTRLNAVFTSIWFEEIFSKLSGHRGTMTKFLQNGDVVLIEGYMLDFKNVSTFLEELEGTKWFDQVKLIYCRKGRREMQPVISFAINLKLPYVENKEIIIPQVSRVKK